MCPCSAAPSCTKFTWDASVKFNSVDEQMKTKFDILRACRDGVIRFCVIWPPLIHLSCVALVFVIQKVPITKFCDQEPQQTPTLTFGLTDQQTCRDSTLDHSFKSGPSIIILLQHLQKTKKQCLPERVQSAVVQTSSARKQQNKSSNFAFICLYEALNLFCLFSLFYFPRWRTIEPNLLRSFVPSRENMS